MQRPSCGQQHFRFVYCDVAFSCCVCVFNYSFLSFFQFLLFSAFRFFTNTNIGSVISECRAFSSDSTKISFIFIFVGALECWWLTFSTIQMINISILMGTLHIDCCIASRMKTENRRIALNWLSSALTYLWLLNPYLVIRFSLGQAKMDSVRLFNCFNWKRPNECVSHYAFECNVCFTGIKLVLTIRPIAATHNVDIHFEWFTFGDWHTTRCCVLTIDRMETYQMASTAIMKLKKTSCETEPFMRNANNA